MSKYCLVPMTELKNLEAARKKLVDTYLPKDPRRMEDMEKIAALVQLIQPVWDVANRSWMVIDLEPCTKEVVVNINVSGISDNYTLEDLTEAVKTQRDSKAFFANACEALIEKIKELKNNQLNLEK